MEELYSIMRNLLQIEYNQKSLIEVLRILETAYSEETQEETKLIANSTQYYLLALQTELRIAINRLDDYVVRKIKK